MERDAFFKCIFVFLVVFVCTEGDAKITDAVNKTISGSDEAKPSVKPRGSSASGLVFADELKQTLERYIFGICPQTYKVPLINRGRNSSATTTACDLDTEQNDLAGRLATLSLRAHSASRGECSLLGAALANVFGELARTAANRNAFAAASSEANKKRKLSKSQKAKIQAKQRTALAVKKKAAAAAAALAAAGKTA